MPSLRGPAGSVCAMHADFFVLGGGFSSFYFHLFFQIGG